jgi:chromosome segregation ATPase
MTASLAELEARVAALEAERADYRAVLAAVNVLGENQREHAVRMDRVESRLDRVESRLDRVVTKLDDTNSRVRSMEENLAEVKDLLVRALDAR